ncbi:MAG: beta-galactosidase, partial [Halanaerobiaceae bacterium]
GLQIVASYVFWIHHQEIEGQFDWSGRRNLRQFIKLCDRHEIPLVLRIGPWAHGECRNGGFPDWLLEKDLDLRSNDPDYLALVRRFYQQIFNQAEGFLFKDGGPLIGIQLENEYGHVGGYRGTRGQEHMKKLKEIAVKVGFEVPFYTATAWGGAVVVDQEMLPVYGGYAATPWARHTDKVPPSSNFVFDPVKNDRLIGTDLSPEKKENEYTFSVDDYPFTMAELGGGNQVTAHRRPLVTADDTEAMALVKLGSGANLLGYYMYHGGTNPRGKLSTLQESTATGYNNDLPVLSYDFQAPLGEYGKPRAAYRQLKTLHLFLQDFGDRLAQTEVFIPDDSAHSPDNKKDLRYAVRYHQKTDSGFVFINNYQRGLELHDHQEVNLNVKGQKRDYRFRKMKIKDGSRAILPFNQQLGGIRLLTASVQLLCKSQQENSLTCFFMDQEMGPIEFLLAEKNIMSIDPPDNVSSIEKGKQGVKVTLDQAKTDRVIRFELGNGDQVNFVVLTKKQARNLWKLKIGGRERIFITAADLLSDGQSLKLFTIEKKTQLKAGPELNVLPEVKGGRIQNHENSNLFSTYLIEFPDRFCEVEVNELEETKENKWYRLKLPENPLHDLHDLWLKIDFAGDRAELFLDHELCADWFYNGRIWRIGLRRFKDRLPEAEIKLKIEALMENDDIYLERKPRFREGRACELLSVGLEPEYSCRITVQ